MHLTYGAMARWLANFSELGQTIRVDRNADCGEELGAKAIGNMASGAAAHSTYIFLVVIGNVLECDHEKPRSGGQRCSSGLSPGELRVQDVAKCSLGWIFWRTGRDFDI